MKLLQYPFKRWRALALTTLYPRSKFVCFTCGNAGRAMKEWTDKILVIGGEEGDLLPNRWFTQKEIHELFPDRIDVTSGHLDIVTMELLGNFYRSYIGKLDEPCYCVPTGSGETLVCLKLAYPETKFIAVYNLDEGTKYEPRAPLNNLVKLLAYDVVMEGTVYEFDN